MSAADPAANAAAHPASKPSNWNLPNALTTLRIVLVPLYGWILLAHQDSPWLRFLAWVVFAVAMVTDKIDGDLARARGQVTDFGKIADPIADKAITGMAFIGLSITGDIWWWVTIVVLLREWSVTLLRLSVARRLVIPAARSGKVKTMAQALALGGLTLPGRLVDGWLNVPGLVLWALAMALLVVAVVLTLSSGWDFYRAFWAQRRGATPAPSS